MKPSAAYHHLERLIEVELVEEAGDRVTGRRTEKLYRAVAPRIRLGRALGDPELADPVRHVVSAMCRQLDRDFSAGVDQAEAKGSGPTRNLGFLRMLGSADAETLREINRRLTEIHELFRDRRHQDGELVAFGWILAPVESPSELPSPDDEG